MQLFSEARGTSPNPSSSSASRLRRPKSTAKFTSSLPYLASSNTPSVPMSSPLPNHASRPLPTPELHQAPALQSSTPRLPSGPSSYSPSRTGTVAMSTGIKQSRPILKSALRGPQPARQVSDGAGGRSPQTSDSLSEMPNSESDGRIPSPHTGRASTIGHRSNTVRFSPPLAINY